MRPDEVAAVVDAIKTGFWSLGILPQGTFELINTAVNERVKEAVEAEREACAKIGEVVSDYVARTIRARGKSEAER